MRDKNAGSLLLAVLGHMETFFVDAMKMYVAASLEAPDVQPVVDSILVNLGSRITVQ